MTKDVDRILQNLMLASSQKIVPEKTLLIFEPLLELHNPVAVLSIRRNHFRDDFPVLKIDLAH